MLHFGEIPKKIGQFWRKFSKFWQKLGKISEILEKKQQKIQQFLTEILRLESDTPLHRSLISKFPLKIADFLNVFFQNFANFAQNLPKCC